MTWVLGKTRAWHVWSVDRRILCQIGNDKAPRKGVSQQTMHQHQIWTGTAAQVMNFRAVDTRPEVFDRHQIGRAALGSQDSSRFRGTNSRCQPHLVRSKAIQPRLKWSLAFKCQNDIRPAFLESCWVETSDYQIRMKINSRVQWIYVGLLNVTERFQKTYTDLLNRFYNLESLYFRGTYRLSPNGEWQRTCLTLRKCALMAGF